MTDNRSRNGWENDAKYVLISLEELKRQHIDSEDKQEEFQLMMIKELGSLNTTIRVLESKLNQRSAAIGALAGFLPAASAFIWMLFKMKAA